MKKLLIASGNKGKIREFKEILKDLSFEFVDLNEILPGFEVEETGKTFEENAVLKAQKCAEKSGLLTIADDSGLEIDFLDGKPGVYSARFFGSIPQEEKNQKILEMMKNVPEEKRNARFICVVAIVDANGEVDTTKGIMEGKIARKARGDNNFGYDPIFTPHYQKSAGQVPQGFEKTNAELSIEEKNGISHRGKALKKAKEILSVLLSDPARGSGKLQNEKSPTDVKKPKIGINFY